MKIYQSIFFAQFELLQKNKFLLLPWIVNTGLELVLTLWDYFNPLVPCLFIAAVFGKIERNGKLAKETAVNVESAE